MRDLFTFGLGILLIVYSILSLSISPAPSNVTEIPNNYGKTYCLPIQAITPTSEEGEDLIRKRTQNAYVLVILALVGGIFLVLTTMVNLYRSLVTIGYLTKVSSRQLQQQWV